MQITSHSAKGVIFQTNQDKFYLQLILTNMHPPVTRLQCVSMPCMNFTGTSTIQSRGEKRPVRGLWILGAWTGSDTPWPTLIRSLVAYANWAKNRQKTSAFMWSGKTIIHCGDSSGGPRTVMFWKRSELAPTFISPLDRLYEPLQYPLFFPHGCCGSFPGLTSTRPPYQRVTQLEYYRQHLLSEPRFGLLGRLLNEYHVDMFSSMEDNRLNYVRQHVQSRIAARRKLDETIEAEGGARTGRVYLPASFMGRPRKQKRLFADGLAVVRRLEKPTYFITVTCNPNWPEIRNHPELHRQNTSDRPD